MSRSALLCVCALAASLAACSGGQQSSLTPATSISDPSSSAASSTVAQPQQAVADTAQAQSVMAGTNSTPATTTSVPLHIPTWAKDEYWGAGANGTSTAARQYLTYAQGGLGNVKASVDCNGTNGCSSVFYFDPSMLYDSAGCGSQSPANTAILSHANETWFVHLTGYTDAAHRVHGTYTQSCGNGTSKSIPVYAMNELSPTLDSFYTSYFHTNAVGFNNFFMDDSSARVLTQFYGPGGGFCWNAPNHYCSSTQEMPTDASVAAEHGALANALTQANGTAMTGFYNGINFTGSEPNDLNILQSSSHFVGAICESCVVNLGTFRPTMYASVLNTMAKMNAMPNAQFVELNHGESPIGSAAQIEQRTITTAIAWLGFSAGHTVVYPDLEANSANLAIFPENSIYPTGALQTMSTGATDIQVATGVYRREFSACYNAGVAIGPCAAIVNGTGGTVAVQSTWLHQAYGHVVAMSGGDIPSGGKISLTSTTFAAGHTTIAPSQGLLIAR